MLFRCSVVLLLILSAGMAQAQDAEAALALALAKDKPEPKSPDTKAKEALEMASKPKPKPKRQACFEDVTKAQAEALRTGRKLVLWIGMQCESKPDVRQALDDCVHCHCDTFAGDASTRIMIRLAENHYFRLAGQYLTPEMAKIAVGEPVKSGPVQVTAPVYQRMPICPSGNCPLR